MTGSYLDGVERYLIDQGADKIPHSGRTLFEHLMGTAAILRSWDCPEEVCAAGMLHSVYGTNAFHATTVDPSERKAVAAVAGRDAEHLAYLFGSSDRPGAFLPALHEPRLRNRRTGELVPVPLESVVNLVEIECANLIEQGAGSVFLRSVVDLAGDGQGPAFRREMIEHARGFLASIERPRVPLSGDLLQIDLADLPALREDFAANDYVRLTGALPTDLLSIYYRYAKSYVASRRYFEFEERTRSLGRYSDALGEILLEDIRPGVERLTGRSLFPTYSFLRFYTPESDLKKHIDRSSCEYSLTIAVGKESTQHAWPILLERNGETRSIELAVGDVLLYKGARLPHWRDRLADGNWLQLFMHYVDVAGVHAMERFDRRCSLGPVVKEVL